MENPTEEYRAAFSLFDVNGDGTVNVAELAQVMRSLGLNPTEEEMHNMLAGQTKTELEFEDFVALMNQRQHQRDISVELNEAFQMFDRDGNGLIDAMELRQSLLLLGEAVTPDEIKSTINELCRNGTGRINFAEFREFMLNL